MIFPDLHANCKNPELDAIAPGRNGPRHNAPWTKYPRKTQDIMPLRQNAPVRHANTDIHTLATWSTVHVVQGNRQENQPMMSTLEA